MKTFDEKTTVIKITELRNTEKLKKALKEAEKHQVILERRSKEEAVLIGLTRYSNMQKTLDTLEDFVLGVIAKAREKTVKESDYIDINEW